MSEVQYREEQEKHTTKETKLKLYKTTAVSASLYCYERWRVTERK
jgi:hypothetical protein